jgi:hypothetical protein
VSARVPRPAEKTPIFPGFICRKCELRGGPGHGVTRPGWCGGSEAVVYKDQLAEIERGRAADAAAVWRAMLASAPADAPWRPLVRSALARVGGPTPSGEDMAAAKGMRKATETR